MKPPVSAEEETPLLSLTPAPHVTTLDANGEETVESIRAKMLREAIFGPDAVTCIGATTSEVVSEDGTVTKVTTPAAPPVVVPVVEDMTPPAVPLKALILPLFAMMPPLLQAKIFAAVPEGKILFVFFFKSWMNERLN